MKRFRYTSLEELRRDYKVENEVSDELLLNLIEVSSKLINNITSQIFDVYRDTIRKIPESRIFYSENLVPILEINNFEMNYNKVIKGGSVYDYGSYIWSSLFGSGTIEEVDSNYYDLREGHINLLFEPRTELVLDAYFGRIEEADEKIEYTVTQDIEPRSTKIYLDSIDDLYKYQSLIINDSLRVIINDARTSGSDKYILVDKTNNRSTIATDSKAYYFGDILSDIRRACALLVLDKLPTDAKGEGGTVPSSGSPLKKEVTDNKQVNVFNL